MNRQSGFREDLLPAVREYEGHVGLSLPPLESLATQSNQSRLSHKAHYDKRCQLLKFAEKERCAYQEQAQEENVPRKIQKSSCSLDHSACLQRPAYGDG
jgi:hypothetical protein